MQADRDNVVLRHINLSTSVVSTVAGSVGTTGYQDGAATSAKFNGPSGIAMDAAGTFALIVSVKGRVL